MSYNRILIEQKIREFLQEDCTFNDVSSKVIPKNTKTSAKIFVKSAGFISGLEELEIITYKGNRHNIQVKDEDYSLKVTISTDNPSNLIVYLVDPNGNIRRPSIPHWNGGEINPIHYWNGGHWEHDYSEFRTLIIEPHKEYTVEIHYPMKGKWTAIVVPYLDENLEDVGFNGDYNIKAEIRKHNPNRVNAALSAANAAVLASLQHMPLLYVDESSIPAAKSVVMFIFFSEACLSISLSESMIRGSIEIEFFEMVIGRANSRSCPTTLFSRSTS